MWKRKPDDWPENVPFFDPNNKIKDGSGTERKPTKDDLFPIMTHLANKYMVGCV